MSLVDLVLVHRLLFDPLLFETTLSRIFHLVPVKTKSVLKLVMVEITPLVLLLQILHPQNCLDEICRGGVLQVAVAASSFVQAYGCSYALAFIIFFNV